MDKGTSRNIDSDQLAPETSVAGACGPLSLLRNPARRELSATLVLAHGAGAPMDSPFMDDMALRLADRGISVVRFEFPYMAMRREDGKRRPPNPQKQLLECWRQVYAQVRAEVPGKLAIGGKSMGGRMASLLADELGADALVCLGYPFYAAGKPEKPRVAHLAELRTPSLIVQGERDALGDRPTVEGYALSPVIHLHWLAAADHDLKPLKASGLTHEQHLESAAARIEAFLLP
ncbi:alpha/beta hydrolase [Pseudomonas nicosulfuronedens]|uniref:alpha/beta family hydrolase n=1 Tax=Pseudomonas nicosulfuronedens TaxID=2571105 RepID=UPI001FE57159|nr:alpha/beta family hydrolase [Pseudomonas nicosulfuronedens]MDH1010176.1 alpha/beta hydrolase [Pseudomonas nicosulfuronedens]MDH1980343.1 alpha/beta hydrolase [Pseudomonas nicosulfuronedens]MDH2025411.1 alpha/beta hydrolase [Pseudomonas nicosulfuronedens]